MSPRNATQRLNCRFGPVGVPGPQKRARESPRSDHLGPGHTWGTPKMALGASRARPSWWRLPTGARRMLRIFSQFSLPPGRATNSRLFPFPHHCRLRFRHLIPRREVTTTEHHSDERSASLDSPFSLLWNSCSRSPEYARAMCSASRARSGVSREVKRRRSARRWTGGVSSARRHDAASFAASRCSRRDSAGASRPSRRRRPNADAVSVSARSDRTTSSAPTRASFRSSLSASGTNSFTTALASR